MGEDAKTGSPFDFMNDVLEENDLNTVKDNLSKDKKTKDLINKYGENATIFAPNDEAFKQSPPDDDDQDPQEKLDKFLQNHLVLGQRIPIYAEEESEDSPESNEEPKNDGKDKEPKIIKSNIAIQGGPLVHIVDQVLTRPVSVGQFQPAMRDMMALLAVANLGDLMNRKHERFENDLKLMRFLVAEPSTFFCPDNAAVQKQFPGDASQQDPEALKRKNPFSRTLSFLSFCDF